MLAQYQRWFRYILVDEYQDTNVAQYLWLRLLAAGHRNICCVGDDDQSIYGWRGAEVGNILRFEKDFPGAQVIRLEQNYRSTPHILAAASGVIAANEQPPRQDALDRHRRGREGPPDRPLGRRGGGALDRRGDRGARPRHPRPRRRSAPTASPSWCAPRFQMRAFEDRFLTIGLPYRVIGGPRFYERQEIRDAMAYFRVAVSPDDDLAFERIVNTPKRGIGDKALQEINRTAREQRRLAPRRRRPARRPTAACRRAPAPPSASSSTASTAGTPRSATAATTSSSPRRILDESGYTDMWRAEKSPDAAGRLDNLKELVKALGEFDNLQGFLEHVSLVMENETDEGADEGQRHDAARRQGPRVPGGLPARLGGRPLPVAALDGRERRSRASRRSAASPTSASPAPAAPLHHLLRRQPPRLQPVAVAAPLALRRRAAARPRRGADPARPLRRRLRRRRARRAGLERSPTNAAKADVYNSPGWKRMQARAGERPVSQPREAQGHGDRRHRRRRLRRRHPRLPPEVRLRHRHRGRGRQARPSTSRRPAARTSSPASSPPPTPCRSRMGAKCAGRHAAPATRGIR